MILYVRSILIASAVLISLSITASMSIAQDNESDASVENAATEAVHDALRSLKDGVIDAISKKDVDAILVHLHEDVVLTMQDGDRLESVRKHSGVRDYMDRLLTGKSPGVKGMQLDVKVDELTILHGDDTGVAFGSSNDHYVLASGGEFDLKTRWSATVVKDGTDWKVANLHVSSNLFDNPVTNTAKSYLLTVGGAAITIGLLVGFVIARMLGRSKV